MALGATNHRGSITSITSINSQSTEPDRPLSRDQDGMKVTGTSNTTYQPAAVHKKKWKMPGWQSLQRLFSRFTGLFCGCYPIIDTQKMRVIEAQRSQENMNTTIKELSDRKPVYGLCRESASSTEYRRLNLKIAKKIIKPKDFQGISSHTLLAIGKIS